MLGLNQNCFDKLLFLHRLEWKSTRMAMVLRFLLMPLTRTEAGGQAGSCMSCCGGYCGPTLLTVASPQTHVICYLHTPRTFEAFLSPGRQPYVSYMVGLMPPGRWALCPLEAGPVSGKPGSGVYVTIS